MNIFQSGAISDFCCVIHVSTMHSSISVTGHNSFLCISMSYEYIVLLYIASYFCNSMPYAIAIHNTSLDTHEWRIILSESRRNTMRCVIILSHKRPTLIHWKFIFLIFCLNFLLSTEVWAVSRKSISFDCHTQCPKEGHYSSTFWTINWPQATLQLRGIHPRGTRCPEYLPNL